MVTRSERIIDILKANKGRMKVSDVHEEICKREGIALDELNKAAIPATVRQDNRTQSEHGKAKHFNIFNDGTELRSYISLYDFKMPSTKEEIIAQPDVGVPYVIEEANLRIREKLKTALKEMSWRKFETNFLPVVLESLGFHDIEITQATRDGGVDAICRYTRGIVKSEAIVSAKHWNKATVSAKEVRELRGIKGNADTGIIITTAKFSKDAVDEAVPSQNQRSMVLIDGDTIVDICLERNIGVSEIEVPNLYNFIGFQQNEEDEGSET